MADKINKDQKTIKEQFIEACETYDRLIKTDPKSMSGEKIIEHSKKCKAALEEKNRLAELFNKLPKSQRFAQQASKGSVK